MSVPASPCEPNPCRNGASCIKGNRRFQCACPEGYTGKFCETGQPSLTHWSRSTVISNVEIIPPAVPLFSNSSPIASTDCYLGNGEAYRGAVSTTDDGHECLNWNSYFILTNGEDPFTLYSDFNGLEDNHCRYIHLLWCVAPFICQNSFFHNSTHGHFQSGRVFVDRPLTEGYIEVFKMKNVQRAMCNFFWLLTRHLQIIYVHMAHGFLVAFGFYLSCLSNSLLNTQIDLSKLSLTDLDCCQNIVDKSVSTCTHVQN